ncbi:MAG: TonB-dependent receptor, partial [Chitinophagaceae bacterium]
RIFESNTAALQLIVPNPAIGPEYTYNADLGVRQQLGKKVQVEATIYYSRFFNAIALAPFRLNGADTVSYNGTRVKVFANQNVNRAFLYGFSASITGNLKGGYLFTSTINYTYGRQVLTHDSRLPLDHIPPVFGKTGFSPHPVHLLY